MTHALVRRLTIGLILAMGSCAYGQEVGSRVPESAEGAGAAAPGAVESGGPAEAPAEPGTEPTPPMDLLDRFRRTFSQEEDPDGPINTDRPTFTPANTVVPRGRLQFESGWTFNGENSSRAAQSCADDQRKGGVVVPGD